MECVIYFEDYRADVLSKLYTFVYEKNTLSIRFSGGNGKLASEVEQLLFSDPEVFVIAVLDMVPENSDIVTIYNHLKMIGRIHPEYQGRYIIIPNICAEYRFIKAFRTLNLFQSQEDVCLCLSRGDYKSSSLLNQLFPEGGVYHNNFEKYCKFILKYTVSRCVSSDSVENDLFQKFYLEDCVCEDCDLSSESLQEKSCRYINTLPFVLHTNMQGDTGVEGDIGYKELYYIHVSLVDEFNKWVDIYRTIYRSPGKKYRHVTPMSAERIEGIRGLKQKIVIEGSGSQCVKKE